MNCSEFLPGDNECIDLVRKNRECHPAGEPMILMKEQEARRLVEQAEHVRAYQELEAETFGDDGSVVEWVKCAGSILPHAVLSLMFIGGAAENLVQPVYAAMMVVFCLLWAVTTVGRGRRNA